MWFQFRSGAVSVGLFSLIMAESPCKLHSQNSTLSVWNANTSWCFLFNRNRFGKCSMFASCLITATNIRRKGAMRREELKSELCMWCNNPSGPTVRCFSSKRLIVYFTHTKNIHLYIGTSVSGVRRSKRMYNLSLFLARHATTSQLRDRHVLCWCAVSGAFSVWCLCAMSLLLYLLWNGVFANATAIFIYFYLSRLDPGVSGELLH